MFPSSAHATESERRASRTLIVRHPQFRFSAPSRRLLQTASVGARSKSTMKMVTGLEALATHVARSRIRESRPIRTRKPKGGITSRRLATSAIKSLKRFPGASRAESISRPERYSVRWGRHASTRPSTRRSVSASALTRRRTAKSSAFATARASVQAACWIATSA
jgi:hypothetical protein